MYTLSHTNVHKCLNFHFLLTEIVSKHSKISKKRCYFEVQLLIFDAVFFVFKNVRHHPPEKYHYQVSIFFPAKETENGQKSDFNWFRSS